MGGRICQLVRCLAIGWAAAALFAIGCSDRDAGGGDADQAADLSDSSATDAVYPPSDTTVATADGQSDGPWAAGRPKPQCVQSGDCPAAPACRTAACASGQCILELAADGQPCGTASVVAGCGPAVCTLGSCTAPSELPKISWGPAAMVVPLTLCGGSGYAAGWAQIPGQLGHAAWYGSALGGVSGSKGVGTSVLWQDGYAAAWQACGGSYQPILVGWRKPSAEAPRQAIVATLANNSVKDLQIHAGPSDTEWTAIAGSYSGTVIAGTAMQVATGQDLRLLWPDEDNLREFPLPGDQYVAAVVPLADGSAVVCGYQAVGNAPADAWLARADDTGKLLWQTALGGEGIQRLHSCSALLSGWDRQAKVGSTLVAVGTTHLASPDGPLPKPWLVAFSAATGAVQWQRVLNLSGEHPAELRHIVTIFGSEPTQAWVAGYIRKKNIEYPWLVRIDETGLPRAQNLDTAAGQLVGIESYYSDRLDVLLHRPQQLPSTTVELRNRTGSRACHCPEKTAYCGPAVACQLETCDCPIYGKLTGEPCSLPGDSSATCGTASCTPKP